MAMKTNEKFEGLKTMILAARKAGNKRATSEAFCVDLGLSWEVFSMYNGIIAGLASWMQPYHAKRREETAAGAELITAKERKALKDPVWNEWKKLTGGLGLKCHQDDFEMIWQAYEKHGRCGAGKDEKVYVSGKSTELFRKAIDTELGIRLDAVMAMSPAEMEYRSELKRLNRQIKSLEARIKTEAETVKKWQDTLAALDMLEDNHPAKVEIKAALEEAEDALVESNGKLESANERKEKCTLENVKKRLEADKIIKKLTAEDLKKEKEAKKAEDKKEEPKQEDEKKEGEEAK